MTWVAVAIGGTQLISGMMGADASRDAANTQAASSAEAQRQQREMFDIQNKQQAAGRGAGYQAFNLIRSMLPGTYTAYDENGNPVGSGTQPVTSGSQMMQGGGGRQYVPTVRFEGGNRAGGAYVIPGQATVGDAAADAWVRSKLPTGTERAAALRRGNMPTLQQLYNEYYTGSADGGGGYQSGQPIGNVTASGDQTGSGYLTKQFNAEDFYNNLDPGYAFRLQQGQAANQAALNKGGGLIGGNVLTGMNDYNQGMASQEYSNAFNRFQAQRTNIYNTLAGIAGLGQVAQGQVNQAGQNYANTQTALITGAGAAQAAGQIGAANAYGNAINGIGNTVAYSQMMKNPGATATQGVNRGYDFSSNMQNYGM